MKQPVNKTNAKIKLMFSILLLPLWVYGTFMAVEFLLALVLVVLKYVGVPIEILTSVVFITIQSLLVYAITLAIVIFVPWKLLKKKPTTTKDLGISGWISWMEILITPGALLIYFICTGIVMSLVMNIAPLDMNQSQALPFSPEMLLNKWQLLLAFSVLVLLAPIAEELLFRGYLYGKLRARSSLLVAVIVTSLAFGLAHLWAGPDTSLQWVVAIDTFVLSVCMCIARELTGAIWVGVLMHMTKNCLAFYFLFVNQDIINQLKSALLPFIN